jgi:hypothetical protein
MFKDVDGVLKTCTEACVGIVVYNQDYKIAKEFLEQMEL